MVTILMKTLSLVWMLLSTVKSKEPNWDDDNSNPSLTNLGFRVHNMTCNVDATVCEHCAYTELVGTPLVVTTEYTTDPCKFQLYFENGMQDWNIYFAQEDQHQEYRWCDNVYGNLFSSKTVRVALCIENTFSDISVPDNCSKPVALVSYNIGSTNEQVRGQQTLYCLS